MEHLPNYEREERPWGNFERFTQNEPTTVKILTIKAGEQLSLQIHKNREEYWRILSGSGKVTIGQEVHEANAGGDYFCPKSTEHRIEAIGTDLHILEIAFGQFDENDIIRLEDKYGRA